MTVTVLFSADFGHLQIPGHQEKVAKSAKNNPAGLLSQLSPHKTYKASQGAILNTMATQVFMITKAFAALCQKKARVFSLKKFQSLNWRPFVKNSRLIWIEINLQYINSYIFYYYFQNIFQFLASAIIKRLFCSCKIMQPNFT